MPDSPSYIAEDRILQAVVCGSFRRDPEALHRDFRALQNAGCTIVSPLDLDFVDEVDGFVYGRHDLGKSTADVEQMHLRAMERADLVWLHCPQGYVGRSAAMEMGFAHAFGIRIFAADLPSDTTLADLVVNCPSPGAAVGKVRESLGDAPSSGLAALQSYYLRAAEIRGWTEETARVTLSLLRGEIDELEEALGVPGGDEAASLELADVQLYLVHLANILGADIGEAVRAKERINSLRFETIRDKLPA